MAVVFSVISPQNANGTARTILGIAACLVLAVPAALAQLTISPPSLPNGAVNSVYSVQLTASGGQGNVWSVNPNDGTLPPGISLSPNGLLSGLPTQAGPYQFTVMVQSQQQPDLAGPPNGSQAYTLTIAPQLIITNPSPLPNGVVGSQYLQTIMATGGTEPYTFTLISTSPLVPLPAWLFLGSQNGELIGTPTTATAYNFFVQVTDSGQGQAHQAFALTIEPALTITTASPLPQATLGANYAQQISASGGTPPYTFSITGTPPGGLSINSKTGFLSGTPTSLGTPSFTIQVTDSLQYNASKQFQVTIVSAPQVLQVSPLQLSFSAVIGGNAPPPQTVTILTPQSVDFTIQITGGAANTPVPAWLKVQPLSGATPGVLVVSVDQTGLPATQTPDTATIQVSLVQNETQFPVNVQVSLTVTTAPAQLQVIPAYLRFAARSSTPAELEQVIAVSNSGGGGSLSFTAAVLQKSSWISNLSLAAAQTEPNSLVLLYVDVNTAGQGVGNHHDIIEITPTVGLPIDVPVDLFVSDQGAILGLNLVGITFPARQGNISSWPKTVNVLDLGDPLSAVNWTATVSSGFDWLSLGASSGTATPGNPGSLSLSAGGGASNFPVGGRYALIQVSDPQALNSPQYLVAVLDVEPDTSPPLPDLSPAGAFFTTATGPPAAQTVNVATSSSAVPFQTATVTTDGANWLTATATTATASTQAPGVVSISVNPAIVPTAGIYTGGVNIAMSGTVQTVNVTFVVVPTSSVRVQFAPATPRPQALTSCTPVRLAATESGLANGFSGPAGWPETLILQLNDDCGNPVTNGSAVASFSNGDPPLSLTGDQQTGLYSATWQPGTAVSPTTVTILASAPALTPVTVQLTGAIGANPSPPPTLVPNATSNIYGAVIGQGLAPGTIAQVYGTGLAAAKETPGVVPLLTEFNGTFMLVGSAEAPLFFLSDDEFVCNVAGTTSTEPCGLLVVQIPNELLPNRQYSIIVSANGALTLPQTIDVVPVQPGIGTYVDPALGSSIVLAERTNPAIPACSFYYECVDSLHPAQANETLVIFLTGMGATTPSIASGNPTPLFSISANVQPTITIDGQPVNFSYAGLTPTGIGLYQIDLVVPKGPFSSNLVDLVVTQNGGVSNTVKLPVATSP